MIGRIALSDNRTFPAVLKYTDIRSYVFTAAFILLSVSVPWVFHQFHLAGPTFLPMHIFVLTAGLLFGWRAGLVVGLFTPLTSYTLSGMPGLLILPQVVIELTAYGLIAGILREKLNLRVMWSLLGAMVIGRLVLFVTICVVSLVSGESYSTLGLESNPFLALWSTTRQSWPGIVIHIVCIPAIVFLTEKYVVKNTTSRYEQSNT